MAQIVDSADENQANSSPPKNSHDDTSKNTTKDTGQDDYSKNDLDNSILSSLEEKMKAALIIFSQLAISVFSYPSTQTVPPLISFDKGGVGVNFLGYHAKAGLGGLLTGNAADGGLFAEAGTPHGQQAAAGLGGQVGQERALGGLYAGATAGGGVGASAGLGGSTGAGGSAGGLYSGASAGGKTVISRIGSEQPYVEKEVEVIKEVPTVVKHKTVVTAPAPIPVPVPAPAPAPVGASAGFSGGVYVSKSFNKPQQSVQVEHVVEEKPPAPQKTYIERTVIPNYVEKTIQVPSYVEKTVRVPTVVEKRVKVPAPPTIIEREVSVPEVPPPPPQPTHVVEVQKVKTVHRPILRKHWRKYGTGAVQFPARIATTSTVEQPVSGDVNSSLYVEKRYNGQLFNDIFNIPISTLQAVNRLVGGIGGGVSGSFTASKHYGTY